MSDTTTEGALRRVIIDYDEKGFPCLADDCPECEATALIVNEWNAVECLTCAWREFGPDDDRADDEKYPVEAYAIEDEDDEAPELATALFGLLGGSGL
jgi:hypothetical protein